MVISGSPKKRITMDVLDVANAVHVMAKARSGKKCPQSISGHESMSLQSELFELEGRRCHFGADRKRASSDIHAFLIASNSDGTGYGHIKRIPRSGCKALCPKIRAKIQAATLTAGKPKMIPHFVRRISA
jgi:hypothetical protein